VARRTLQPAAILRWGGGPANWQPDRSLARAVATGGLAEGLRREWATPKQTFAYIRYWPRTACCAAHLRGVAEFDSRVKASS
jgi:hypothetical protein